MSLCDEPSLTPRISVGRDALLTNWGHDGVEDPGARGVEEFSPLPGRGFHDEMSENLARLDGHDARRHEVALLLEIPVIHMREKGCSGPMPDPVLCRVSISALMLCDL